MPMWVLEDDCLAPQATVKYEYTGPNPLKFYLQLKSICKGIFEIESKDYYEKEFRWDNSEDPHEFVAKVYIKKGMDAFSTIFFEIYIQGWQPTDPTKDGKIKIEIGAKLRTATPENDDIWLHHTTFYKGLRYFYFKWFYNDIRRGYMKMCRWNYLEKFIKELQRILGISPPNELGDIGPGTIESRVKQ